MARVCKVEIENFRGIKAFTWFPSPGVNCLIGPGDSGKSTILDAIDYCLGARRNIQFTDTDFHRLAIEEPIKITVTIGELDDGLKKLDAYGLYVRGFNLQTGAIEDEPEKELETVLTVQLTVASDLEPLWSLVSERAAAQDQSRSLSWPDRLRIAPTRIGAMSDYHLGWRRGSVLNRLSEESVDTSKALTKAARDARTAFGDQAQEQLGETLGIVANQAKELGIPLGENVRAMLDANSVSFSGGTVSLHDEEGVPLRSLGTGSTRLLIAGLQRQAADQTSIILIDELEYGLEPHRIIRLLGSLGAKEANPPLQAFMTTHSPVALRELSGNQLFVVRPSEGGHVILPVGSAGDVQGTIRLFPDAFLAPAVIICEGASEVGLVRGLDQYGIDSITGHQSISAQGVALISSDGGDPDRPHERAAAFEKLGYQTAILRDDDKKPTEAVEADYIARGGKVIAWRDGRALEDELFLSLSNNAVGQLLSRAIELVGADLVDQHIMSVSGGMKGLTSIQAEIATGAISTESRQTLGMTARKKNISWFKSLGKMESVARDIVGPDFANAEAGFKSIISDLFGWAANVGK